MVADFQIPKELKEQFCREASDNLEMFETALSVLDQDRGNQQAVEKSFRAIHSIKGNSDYLGFKDINKLSHDLEELLSELRANRIEMNEDVLEICYHCLDLLRIMNGRVLDEVYQETDISDISERIQALVQSASSERETKTNFPRVDILAVFARSSSQHISFVRKCLKELMEGAALGEMRENLKRVLNTFRASAAYVGNKEAASRIQMIEEVLDKEDSVSHPDIESMLNSLSELESLVASNQGKSATKVSPSASIDAFADIRQAEIKVSSVKIDQLMDLVSELVIASNSLNHLIQQGENEFTQRDVIAAHKKAAATIDDTARRLQDAIMTMRLMKFSSILDRVPRIVRETARRSGKKVRVAVSGGHVEVDRKVIELLVDPLVHVLRNAVDHGIESSDDRKRLGKPEVGMVRVNVQQQGKYALVEISDDGAGIDEDAVKREAVARKIASQDQIESMSRGELLTLVFASGFSTKSSATSLSGRGVGLDVVKTNIKSAGGNVTLSSVKGAGTTVRIQVPISLGVIEVLLTELSGETYAIPMSSVVETLRLPPGQVQFLNSREVFQHKGEVLVLQNLSEVLGTSPQNNMLRQQYGNEIPVILVAFGGQVRALVVDKIIKPAEILARPLERQLYNIKELSSAALMGDGSIVLVIDQMGLFQ